MYVAVVDSNIVGMGISALNEDDDEDDYGNGRVSDAHIDIGQYRSSSGFGVGAGDEYAGSGQVRIGCVSRVSGSGFRVQGFGFRISGFRFRV